MNRETTIYRLLEETEAYLRKIEATLAEPSQRDLVVDFAEDFHAEAIRPALLSHSRSQSVRGLRYAPVLFDENIVRCPELFDAALGAFPYAWWSEFYEEAHWSKSFVSRFATGECIGPTGRFRSDSIILGLFILGPDTHYPAHAHAAEEFYIVVAGEAEFQTGATSDFIAKCQGDIVLHGSNVSHAIRTSSRPMFAIYGWRGALDEPSWYRDNMADESEPRKFPNFVQSKRDQ